MSAAPPAPLPALTGLRFVAALQVVLFHAAQPLLRDGPTWLRNVAGSGYVSVGLFFLLSGFILAYAYQQVDLTDAAARRRFWVARVARIYPVYLLGLVLAAPYFVETATMRHGDPTSTIALVAPAALTLTQAWIPAAACQWNCPGWSLSAEAFFYLLFPAVAVVTARWPLRRVAIALILLCLAPLVAPLAYQLLEPDGLGAVTVTSRAPWLTAAKFSPLVRLPEFLAGVALGRLFVLGRRNGWSAKLDAAAPWMTLAAVAGIAGVLAASDRLPYLLLHNGLLTPLFALLVLGLAAGRDLLSRLLAAPPMLVLGEASYALYIIHGPVFLWALRRLPFIELGLPHALPGVALYLLLAALLAVEVNRRLEVPARRWFLRWAEPRREAGSAPVTARVAAPR